MALQIVELFGFPPENMSEEALQGRTAGRCPFLGDTCTKRFRDNTVSGVCTVAPLRHPQPVICCPNRLYANTYEVLEDVAKTAFGPNARLITRAAAGEDPAAPGRVVAFGKRWGKELRLPQKEGRGGFFVDWVLALLNGRGELEEFVAIEVQSIDTTGNYRAEWEALMSGRPPARPSPAGLNWENVSKRILPQLIYKGHVLRRERLCTKGLFFICPTPVYDHIQTRLAHDMMPYPAPAPGTLTLMWYTLGPLNSGTGPRRLLAGGTFTTTIDQLAVAFTAPRDLPSAGVYEAAITAALAGP